MAVWTTAKDSVRLSVRVQPRGSSSRVVGLWGDALKVQVTAPPVEGAANEAVIAVLSEWLEVPRRVITIVRGDSGRDKVVEIAVSAPANLVALVEAKLAPFVDKAKAGG